ncbi:MAG: hypothetical protein DRI90_08485 [Deltaproteobacteria bacterium]|nr:MAG: hypothetical protein DRI90_08485 [Deltaproteobacteria bacterium]
MWRNAGGDPTCVDLDTYGSDRLGTADAQVGFGISALSGGGQCTTYWTGLAGRDVWRYDAGDSTTELLDAGGGSADGFVMRVDGSDGLACGVAAAHGWNLRLTPSEAATVVWGNRVATNACAEGAVATVLISDAAGSTVALNRCQQGGSCDVVDPGLVLAGGDSQLLVTGLSPAGNLRWYAVFGPVAEAAFDAGGAPVGVARDNLALDNRGNAYLAFATTGPLATENVSLVTECLGLQLDAPVGVYVAAFAEGGTADNAACSWAHYIAP